MSIYSHTDDKFWMGRRQLIMNSIDRQILKSYEYQPKFSKSFNVSILYFFIWKNTLCYTTQRPKQCPSHVRIICRYGRFLRVSYKKEQNRHLRYVVKIRPNKKVVISSTSDILLNIVSMNTTISFIIVPTKAHGMF